MNIKMMCEELSGPNASVEFKQGDHLSIAFKNAKGNYRIVNISMRGKELVVTDEQTCDTLVIREQSSQFVMG